jgi:hypothetical protein
MRWFTLTRTDFLESRCDTYARIRRVNQRGAIRVAIGRQPVMFFGINQPFRGYFPVHGTFPVGRVKRTGGIFRLFGLSSWQNKPSDYPYAGQDWQHSPRAS